jgi:hypothetical protein
MTELKLIIDGMLSGTGIRDSINGGYLELDELGISKELQAEITDWLRSYESAHFHNFKNHDVNKKLDKAGLEITDHVRKELPSTEVKYFSNAYMKLLDE